MHAMSSCAKRKQIEKLMDFQKRKVRFDVGSIEDSFEREKEWA